MKLHVKKFEIGGEFASLAVNYIPTSASTTAGAYAPAVASSENSSKSSSSKDELNMKDVLKVFDNVKGLPIDVLYVLKDFQLMFADDSLLSFNGKPSYSSLVSYYLNNVEKFNALRESKEQYDQVRLELISNGSLNEIAIDRDGKIVVMGENGGLDAISLKEYQSNPESFRPLTNKELLKLRLKQLPFEDSIYAGMTGIGMDNIVKKINALVNNIGTTETKIEGFTSKQSQDVREGLNLLQGVYKETHLTKDLTQQALLAILALMQSLNPYEKTLLTLHSTTGKPEDFVQKIIASKLDYTDERSSILQANLNPDGSKKSSSSEKDSKEGNDNPLTLMQEMKGGDYRDLQWITKEGTKAMGTQGVHYSTMPKIKGDASLSVMLHESGIAGIVKNMEGITFGDLKIPVENLKDIMYNEGGGDVVILPAKTDEYGNLTVDLSIMDQYNKIVNSIEYEKGSEAWQRELALKLHSEGLDQYLENSDTLDWRRFGEFLIVAGTTTDRWKFNKDSKWVEKVSNPTKADQDRLNKALSTKDNSYDVDIDDWGLGWFMEGGYDDLYRGTVYIPLTNNRNAAVNAWGDHVSHEIGQMYERNYQNLLGKVLDYQSSESDILEEQ